MADQFIRDLTAAASLSLTDNFIVDQGGDAKKTTLQQLKDEFAGGGGTKTYGTFTFKDFFQPPGDYSVFDTRNSLPLYNFSATSLWSVFMLGIMPEGAVLTSGLKVRLHWLALSATEGNVQWRVEFERGDTDLDTNSFDTAAEATAACDATSGKPVITEITIATIDGITSGDVYRLRVSRVGNDATNDTMSNHAQLLGVEVRGAS